MNNAVYSKYHFKRQRGVALITILLVFSIAAVMASQMANRLFLDIRKAGFIVNQSQAHQYALGAEALARQILHQDFIDDAGELADHLYESWREPTASFAVDGGEINIQIKDLHSRFNLNNLLDDEGKVDTNNLGIFRRLLERLDIDKSFANNVVDWLDHDLKPLGANSEDQYYLAREISYRTANIKITHLSELKMIKGFDELELSHWLVLQKAICVLPTVTAININTASELLLSSLHQNLRASDIVDYRESVEGGFTSMDSFLEHSLSAGIELDTQKLSVHSRYFEIQIKAVFQDRRVNLVSLLYRNPENGNIKLIQREILPFWETPDSRGDDISDV